VQFDHEQYVQPGQADRVHRQEFACEHPFGLVGQELCPRWAAAAGCRSEVVAAQDAAN
jgi:hypothetical protein